MTDKPWLLIDVDGVLNPVKIAPGFGQHEMVPDGWTGPPLNVQLSPEHGGWIRRLTDVFDLVWATTWENSANTLIAPIVGLPDDLPVVPFTEPRLRHHWDISFKSPAVARYVGSHPFAWLDDSITDEDTRWFHTVDGIGPFHLQHVDPVIGLTELDCRTVRRWAEKLG